MKWYRSLQKTAAKPPSYLAERVSDLRHASDVAKTSPRDSIELILKVVEQLSAHHDEDFLPALREACRIMRDSPVRAREAVEKVAQAMLVELED